MAQTVITRAPSVAIEPPVPPIVGARRPLRAAWVTIGALALAAAVVVIASQWGEALLADGVRMKIHTPPLRGGTNWRPGRTMLPAVGVAVFLIGMLPAVARRAPWWWLMAIVAGGAVLWAVALAVIDGRLALTEPLLSQQYIRTVPRIHDLGTFLRTFTDRLPTYNIHTQGHPPGMVALLWTMQQVGLGGLDPNAVLVFVGGGAGMVATLVAVRDVAGETLARAAAPFLALTPAAIWWSSGDAFFAGVSATAVALLVLATNRAGRRADALAVLGGVAFAATLFLSYGLVLLAVIPLAVAFHRRRWRPIVVAAVTVAVAMLAVALGTGFAWWQGLAATRARYFAGVASHRPYDYFLLANVAVVLLAIGPAGVAGLTRLRRSPLVWLVGAAAAAVLLADVSGMSKAEVERIWLPFFPWLVAGAALVGGRAGRQRWWLAAQAGLALLVGVAVMSPW
jgi:hypothetical protein